VYKEPYRSPYSILACIRITKKESYDSISNHILYKLIEKEMDRIKKGKSTWSKVQKIKAEELAKSVSKFLEFYMKEFED
jgi:hypothetical protein